MASKLTYLPFLCVLFFIFTLSEGSIGNNTIKHLQGSHKGSKVPGLHNLKLYLARFGYLNYQHTPNGHFNAHDDEFDDELEVALKSYQTFYHLNASGSLDGPTIFQMLMPRCGQPDHVKPHHQHGTKLLHIVSNYTFIGNNLKWPPTKTHLTYAFGPNYPNVGRPPVARAFRKWAYASEYFTFSRVYDVTRADLKISFGRGDHGDGYPFAEGILAHAFAPTDGRFHYNADYKWSVGPGVVQDAFDLGSVALHEIGHLLGLGHSDDPDSIMWSGIEPGVIKGLNLDDIEGIKDLYEVPN